MSWLILFFPSFSNTSLLLSDRMFYLTPLHHSSLQACSPGTTALKLAYSNTSNNFLKKFDMDSLQNPSLGSVTLLCSGFPATSLTSLHSG